MYVALPMEYGVLGILFLFSGNFCCDHLYVLKVLLKNGVQFISSSGSIHSCIRFIRLTSREMKSYSHCGAHAVQKF